MKKRYLSLIVLIMAGVVLSCHRDSNNFTQFRGNNCLGIAPKNANPPVEVSNDINGKWNIELANGVASPCVVNNKIFVTGFNEADSALITYCVRSSDGKIEWQHAVHPDLLEPIHQVGSQAAATPASDGKYVYVYFGSYGILCYDKHGSLVWEKRLPLADNEYGSSASPIISGEKLILNRLGNNQSAILALNKNNGEELWKTSLDSPPGFNKNIERSHATPVIWKNQIIINSFMNFGESRIHDVLPDFEEMLEEFDINGDNLIQITEIPKELAYFRRPELDLPLANDTMYSWRRIAPSFDSSGDQKLDENEWQTIIDYFADFMKDHGVLAFKLKESDKPELLWKVNDYVAEVPSLLYENNRVYMVTNGGYVTCMDSETGDIFFREKLGAPGAYIASPLIANHHIYFTSYNGRLTVIEPGDELKILAVSDLHEKIAASPVAVGEQLLIRSVNGLEAFVN